MQKMMNKAHNLADYSFSKGETFLFDTNVWVYLYPPPSSGSRKITKQYSAGLKSIRLAGAQLVMDALVVSEYLNTYCRIEWNARFKNQYGQFKSFRKSPGFKQVGKNAADDALDMLKLCACHDHPFAAANITQVLKDFAKGSNDFNDGLLTETCRINNWKLVTHDSDFRSGGIEVFDYKSETSGCMPIRSQYRTPTSFGGAN